MFRGSVLLFALAVNAPIIWQALGAQTVSPQTAVIHFLVAIPIGGILLGILRTATTAVQDKHAQKIRTSQAHRRSDS